MFLACPMMAQGNRIFIREEVAAVETVWSASIVSRQYTLLGISKSRHCNSVEHPCTAEQGWPMMRVTPYDGKT